MRCFGGGGACGSKVRRVVVSQRCQEFSRLHLRCYHALEAGVPKKIVGLALTNSAPLPEVNELSTAAAKIRDKAAS